MQTSSIFKDLMEREVELASYVQYHLFILELRIGLKPGMTWSLFHEQVKKLWLRNTLGDVKWKILKH